jgi:hypothetical protein
MSDKTLRKVVRKFKRVPRNGKYPMSDIPLFVRSAIPLIVPLDDASNEVDVIGFVYIGFSSQETVDKAIALYESLLNLQKFYLREAGENGSFYITQGDTSYGGVMCDTDENGKLSICVYVHY